MHSDKMGSITEGQTYCLRWNNHKSNLVEILDALIKMESYVDCTIVVDDQVQFKAHRVVLAANSPYFQSILQDVPMDHCSILFPGVQAFEMRALLEYMYTGEVNVTQSQIPKIMKIAEQLEVKGLFDITDLKEKFNKFEERPSHYLGPTQGRVTPTYSSSTSSSKEVIEQQQQQQHRSHLHQHPHLNQDTPQHQRRDQQQPQQERQHHLQQQPSSPVITTSTNVSSGQSCSSPPPYNYKSSYSNLYSKSPGPSGTAERQQQQWPLAPHLPVSIQSAAAAMLGSVYESGSDMNPLKRKKLSSVSSMLMSRDTPILRNVLAQPHAADSSQPVPLISQGKPERTEKQGPTGNNCNGSDYSGDKKSKYEEPHSPYTDKSFEDDGLDPSYPGDSRMGSYHGQQQQKPEWKRYKQYTRSDILSAIECVRNGMSALQASRKYGVPSRTLYDKVKKLGITTGRPMNRTLKRSPSAGSGQAGFPFSIGSSAHSYGSTEAIRSQIHEAGIDREKDREHHLTSAISHSAAALLQQAFEGRGGDIAGREALHAMALAAAAHAAVNGISTSPGTNGTARSPSPNFPLKYQRSQSPPPPHMKQEMEPMDEDEDHVEDLSISKRDSQSPPPRAASTPTAEAHHHSSSFYHHHHRPHSNEQPHHHSSEAEHDSDDQSHEQREREVPLSPHPHQHRQTPQPHQQTGGVIVPPMTTIIPTNGRDEYPPNPGPLDVTECKRECITEDSRD